MKEFELQNSEHTDIPEMGLDSDIVRLFFDDTLKPSGYDLLTPDQLKKLKSERYVPASGEMCDLQMLEGLSKFSGRIKASEPDAINDIYRKYGNQEKLRQVFDTEIGYADVETLEAITKVVSEVADEVDGDIVKDSLIVVDDLDTDGETRAYLWPFIGIRSPIVTTHAPKGAEEKVKQKLAEYGVKPWRVGTISMIPSARTQRGVTVAVFLGK